MKEQAKVHHFGTILLFFSGFGIKNTQNSDSVTGMQFFSIVIKLKHSNRIPFIAEPAR